MHRWIALAVTLLAVLATPRPAHACAPAPPDGHAVSILGEEAVIVWDASTKVEHFIRRADFRTDAASFGFIVPTPSVPELAEASAALFDRLGAVVRPPVQTRRTTSVVPVCLPLSMMMLSRSSDGAGAAPAAVHVLHHQAVAGYDAVVLRAADPDALREWLSTNGYAATDDLATWAAHYVEQDWVFTAFKLAPRDGDDGVATAPVHMTFSTERPVYPYREPEDQRRGKTGPRALRVFFIGSERHTGTLADAIWPGELTFAAALSSAQLDGLLDPALLPATPYLSTFVDRSNPRPGTADLFFAPKAGGDVRPPPIVRFDDDAIPIPIGVIVLAVGAGWYLLRRRREARTRTQSSSPK